MPVLSYPSRAIAWGRAVNWDHPLNRGLTSWHLAGGPFRGTLWPDLVSSQHDGVLASTMAPTSSWWSAIGRPGGFGSLKFDGGNDVITCGTSTATAPAGEMTASAWFNTGTPATLQQIFGRHSGGASQSFAMEVGRTSGRISVIWTSTVVATGSLTVSANTWYRYTFVRTGTTGSWTASLYLNGILDASAGTSTNPLTSGTTVIGDRDTPTNPFNGYIDDTRTWNRALTPSEVWADYVESRQGYPGTLNRVTSTRRVFNSAGGGGGGNRRRRLLLCGARA